VGNIINNIWTCKGDSIYMSSFIFKIPSRKCHIKHTLFWSKYWHLRSAVVRYLVVYLAIQSMPIINKTTSLIPAPWQLIQFVGYLWQVGCFVWVLNHPPTLITDWHDITDILLNVSKTPIPIKQAIYFLWSILLIIVCPIVLFLLTIMVSVLLRFTTSDYSFVIFRLFLSLT
jgi:hypothetical protein